MISELDRTFGNGERFKSPIAGSVLENQPFLEQLHLKKDLQASESLEHTPSQLSGKKNETMIKDLMEKISNCYGNAQDWAGLLNKKKKKISNCNPSQRNCSCIFKTSPASVEQIT